MEDWKYDTARDLELTPGERNRSLQRESDGLVAHSLRFCWWSAMRTSFTLFHRLEVRGTEHLPDSPSFVLAANHASHLDAMVLGAALPLRLRHRIFPLAAGDTFFETPVLAAFAANVLNALPVWRKSCGAHDIKALRRRLLEEPSVYILFPEGTRSRTGEIGKFKVGIGMLAAGTPVPVLPCYLQGTYDAFPPGCRLPRFTKLRLQIGPPLIFAEQENRRGGWQEVAQQLEAEVRRLAGEPEDAETS